MDKPGSSDDHLLVSLVVVLATRGGEQDVRWRPCNFREEALANDASRQRCFRQALQDLPLVAWQVPLDEHEVVFTGGVRKAAEQAFGDCTRKKRQVSLEPGILELIAARRRVRVPPGGCEATGLRGRNASP